METFYLVFLINLLYVISANSTSSEFEHTTADQSSLLFFKSLIIDDPYKALSSWNDSLPYCNWHGISCSRRHPERVAALELDSLLLAGSISTSLANLTFLQRISLSGNRFTGLVPKELGRLHRLQYLNLSVNSLYGTIPPSLGNCSNLQVISLRSNKLTGTGSFGSVYKGDMKHENAAIVAVKVLNLQQHGASKSFTSECEALRSIRHRNLVKILTSCSSLDHQGNDFKALVYAYMPNGNLEEWLHPNACKNRPFRSLNLIQRLNIAIDIASALEYLHHHGSTPIVHCDLKPSNVLLDDDMVAHVGDFGLAKFLIQNQDESPQQSTSTTGIKGSIGYIPPEYGMGSQASILGDVYSYGILLLELFTGISPIDNKFKEGLSLHMYAQMAFPEQVITK